MGKLLEFLLPTFLVQNCGLATATFAAMWCQDQEVQCHIEFFCPVNPIFFCLLNYMN